MAKFNLPKAAVTSANISASMPAIQPMDQSVIWDQLTNKFLQISEDFAVEDARAKGIESQEASEGELVSEPFLGGLTAPGRAFIEGRNQSFLIQKENEITEQVGRFANENKLDPTKFKEQAEKYYEKFSADIPIELRPALNQAYRSFQQRKFSSIQAEKFKLEREEQTFNVTKGIENLASEYELLILQGQQTQNPDGTVSYSDGISSNEEIAGKFVLRVAQAKRAGLISSEQADEYMNNIRVTAVSSQHVRNLKNLPTAASQQDYIDQYRRTKIDPKTGIRSVEERDQVLSIMEKQLSVSKDEETAELRQTKDEIARMSIAIERGEPFDITHAQTYISAAERLDPDGTRSAVDSFRTMLSIRHKASRIARIENHSILADELATMQAAKVELGDAFTKEDEEVMRLLSRKVYDLGSQIRTGDIIRPERSLFQESPNQEPELPNDRDHDLTIRERQLGARGNFYTPEEVNELDSLWRSDRKSAIQRIEVPFDRREQTFTQIAKTNPTLGLTSALYHSSLPGSKLVADTVLKGYQLPDTETKEEDMNNIRQALLELSPVLEGTPYHEAYAEVAYQYMKTKGSSIASIREATAKLFGFSDQVENYNINGMAVVPFEYGMSAGQTLDIWSTITMETLKQQNNGLPYIESGGEIYTERDLPKESLALEFMAKGRYRLVAQSGENFVPVLNTTGGFFTFTFDEKVKEKAMLDLSGFMTAPNQTVPTFMSDEELIEQEVEQTPAFNAEDPVLEPQSTESVNMAPVRVEQPMQPAQVEQTPVTETGDTLGQQTFGRFLEIKRENEQKEQAFKEQLKEKSELAKGGIKKAYEDLTATEEAFSGVKAGQFAAQRMADAIVSGLDTGFWENLQMAPQQVVAGTFLEGMFEDIPGELVTKEVFAANGEKMALDMAEKMKGALSDSDRQWLRDMAPGLKKTPDANLEMLAVIIAASNIMDERKRVFDSIKQTTDDPREILKELDKQWKTRPLSDETAEVLTQLKTQRDLFNSEIGDDVSSLLPPGPEGSEGTVNIGNRTLRLKVENGRTILKGK